MPSLHAQRGAHAAPAWPAGGPSQADDPFGTKSNRIIDREDDYRKRRLNRIISPERVDAFAMGDKTPDARVRTYADTMREAQLDRERDNTMRNIADKQRKLDEEAAAAARDAERPTKASGMDIAPPVEQQPATGKRRNRWDTGAPGEA